MPQDPTQLIQSIEPFKRLWQKVRVAGVAILKEGRWVSLCTHIVLSHMPPAADFFIQPTPDFIGFSSDCAPSVLEGLILEIARNGRFSLRIDGKVAEIFL